MFSQLAETCGSYAISILKPLLDYFEETKKKIAANDLAMESKNNILNELTKEVSELKATIASYAAKDKIIELFEGKEKLNEELIKSLKQEIQLQSKLTEKQVSNTCDKQINIIAQLNQKVNADAIKIVENEKQLLIAKQSAVQKDLKIYQLETKIKNLSDELKEKPEQNAKSCISFGHSSDAHKLTLSMGYSLEVLCNSDIAGPGWTVIQQRINGQEDFQKNWNEYKDGFGNFEGDFFLGLEKIHRLTSEQPHELYIQLKRFDGSTFYGKYNEFAISNEYDKYKLTKLGTFEGNTSDELRDLKDMKFSTYDRDNDLWVDGNCASHYRQGGWWYKVCGNW